MKVSSWSISIGSPFGLLADNRLLSTMSVSIQYIYQYDKNVPFDWPSENAQQSASTCAERAAQGWERTTRPRGWSVLAWGKHSRRRSACRPVLQQNSGDLRGTLLVRSDDLLTFLGISAVRTRLGRSSRGEHEHYFRQLFRGGIPPEPTV